MASGSRAGGSSRKSRVEDSYIRFPDRASCDGTKSRAFPGGNGSVTVIAIALSGDVGGIAEREGRHDGLGRLGHDLKVEVGVLGGTGTAQLWGT